LHWVNKQPLRDIYHVHCAKQCDWDWCAKPKNNSTTLFTSFLHTVNIALFFGLVIDRARGTLKSGICLCILCILRVRNNGHCQLGACVKNHRPYRRRHRPRRGQYKLNWPLSLVLTLPLTLTLGYTRRPLAASKSELFRKCYSQTANQG